MESQGISVCYCGNKKMFEGITLSVLSILETTPSVLTVYILTMDLTERDERYTPISLKQAEALDKILKSYNPQNSAVLIDVGEDFKKRLSKSKNLKNSFTPYAFIRLLLDLYIQKYNIAQKVIYLDADVMICRDLNELYSVDMTDYEIAMVKDAVGSHWIRPSYCNSGVVLINFKNVLESDLFGRARRRVVKRRMFMPDQSALNFLSKKKLVLPRKFNEQRKIQPDTVVKHFCRYFKWYGPFFTLHNCRQWERDLVHNVLNIHDFDYIYDIYDGLNKQYGFDSL